MDGSLTRILKDWILGYKVSRNEPKATEKQLKGRTMKMESQNKTTNIVRGVPSGIGVAILYLLLGMVLDYGLTQILSQYFIPNCSEDCYFKYFNAMFLIVAFLSIAGGVRAGVRACKRSTEKQ
jgi:hypothetical protein